MLQEILDEIKEVEFDLKQTATILLVIGCCEQQHEDTGKFNGHFTCPICKTGQVKWSTMKEKYTYWVSCNTAGCIKVHADGKDRNQKNRNLL